MVVASIPNKETLNKEMPSKETPNTVELAGGQKMMDIQEPFKRVNRKYKLENTVVRVGDVAVGDGGLVVIAGPCSVESAEQISEIAAEVQKSGAQILRGGAFKPRTSPYAFQGMEEDGLNLLSQARTLSGLPVVSELMSPKHLELFEDTVDMIQIGARNMQNFDLLREVGRSRKPVLLKRGLSATIEEWLMAAEYILAHGNENVVLCERGIRTFETYTRNTLDLSSILAIKRLSHLPVVVDPSHACGKAWMVRSLALGAVAVGADGLLIEVHNDPKNALCDGPQSITPAEFSLLMQEVTQLKAALNRFERAC